MLTEVPLQGGTERALGLFRGNLLNMKPTTPESTSPTGSALEPVAKAASSSLGVLWGQERGGSIPNLHLGLCPHPGHEENIFWSLQNMLRVIKDFPFSFPFSIPFPGCAP